MSVQQVPAGFDAENADNFEEVCSIQLLVGDAPVAGYTN